MALSASTIETMVKEYKPADTEEEAGESEKATEEATTNDTEEETTEEETTTLTYNGKDYIVNKEAFEKWLGENGTLA